MILSGNQKRTIHEALLNAYATHAQLAMIVSFELDADLYQIYCYSIMMI